MSGKKITYIVTHADDDPEMASIPFVLANTAVAMDVTPVIIVQGKRLCLQWKDTLAHIHFEGFNPHMEMTKSYIEAGNQLLVCTRCKNIKKNWSRRFNWRRSYWRRKSKWDCYWKWCGINLLRKHHWFLFTFIEQPFISLSR